MHNESSRGERPSPGWSERTRQSESFHGEGLAVLAVGEIVATEEAQRVAVALGLEDEHGPSMLRRRAPFADPRLAPSRWRCDRPSH